MNLNELKMAHPMPWRYALIGPNVQLLDAAGKELPMFVMLDFACEITRQVAAQAPQATPV